MSVSAGFPAGERGVTVASRRFSAPPVKLFAVGQEAVGVVAIGQLARGVIVVAGQWLLDDLTRRTEVPAEAPEAPPRVPLC